ncbi:MAG: exonuclease domain-containing protein [Acidimicrobiales bacterium]
MGLFKKAVAVATGKISPPGAVGGAGRTGGCVGVDLEFAFLDVETTGLEPWKDRVIEIGIVVTDGLGRPIDQWCSLVNPGTGDAGPTRIHLIESSWLAAAPTFAQLAGDIAQRLSNRVLVCHNSSFDAEFLDAEYARAGLPIADLSLPTVDTMTLANTVGLPRGLQKACMELGYYYDSHNALDDAIACAELFHRLTPMIQQATFDAVTTVPIQVSAPPFGKVVGRQQASAAVKPRSVLSEFTQYLYAHNPAASHDDADLQRYRDIVISAIEDGYIDDHEQYAMASTGHQLGLSAIDIAELHHEVVLGMIDAALEDRRISKDEKSAIERAAVWLDVDLSDWDQLVKASRKRVTQRRKEFAASLSGKTVVFTGRGVHPNNIREALAIKHGMDPKKQITSKTELVVIGSADVDNATVQTARSAGIPIVIESTLWQRLGET